MDQFTEYKASKDNYLVADSAYLKSLEFIKKPPDWSFPIPSNTQ